MPMLRLPRLACSISGLTFRSSLNPPIVAIPRWVSPRSGCSTLITSAPQSARIAPAAGTNTNCATSRTRTPFMTLVTGSRSAAGAGSGDRALGLVLLDPVPLDAELHQHQLGVLGGDRRAGGDR